MGEALSAPVQVAANERWAVRCAYDKVVLHDLADGRRSDELPLDGALDSAWSLCLSPDHRRLAVGTDRGVVLVFELTNLPGR